MTFSKQLNKYIEQLNCSSQDLVTASGLSSTVISRYRKGERSPSLKSNHLDQLVNGLYTISCTKNIGLDKEDIYNTLSNSLNDINIEFEQLSKNFNSIVSALDINIADLARFIGYDASFLSRIRNGNTKPAKPQDFIESVCNFVVTKYSSSDNKNTIAILLSCDPNELDNNADYLLKLSNWFATNISSNNKYISDFLNNLDTFDLNQYIKAIHFDELKIPFVPFYKTSSRNYYGIDEMKKGELDFFKATVLSKSSDPVFMCSDMPIEDMAKDIDFGKKWMFAIAMTLKKGLHLNIIHNLDRPFNEMMLGLESWIPIYMTGQVSPFYLKGTPNSIYCHLNYVSGNVALNGECIADYHATGKYYLTTAKSEVAYYKEKAKNLLNKSQSLMEIYRIENKNDFKTFLSSFSKSSSNFRRILSSLPIHTISDELLLNILKRNKISDSNIKHIINFVKEEKKLMEDILKKNIFLDEVCELSKEDFENQSFSLSLSNDFSEEKIYYNYEEYKQHLKLTKEYEKAFKNYKLFISEHSTFKNIQILINENNWVMISKDTSPSIHFVIKHPKLRNAIENFIPPVIE